jgi:hypothetical protein
MEVEFHRLGEKMRKVTSSTPLRLVAALCLTAAFAFSASIAGMTTGKAPLKSAGPLAFGPDGVLFVGDTAGAAIVAIDTRDNKAARSAAPIDVKGINEKVAALLGTSKDQILINDIKVNPISKNVYLSVSRGKGPDATPVILRLDASGKMSELSLDSVDYAAATIPNPPSAKPGTQSKVTYATNANPRLDTVTEIAYVNGSVVVAGLSNEEFSSNLRTIPFPFKSDVQSSNIEIYHGSHGRYETQAPVRTFVPYTIKNKQYIVAAYTCTPLVVIPMSDLKGGTKVKGSTIAELGAHNRPIDMIAYKKDNHDYILMANSARGVMKVSADHLETYKPITAPSDIAGVPYQIVSGLTGVTRLTSLDDSKALILTESNGAMYLRSVPLP